MLAALLFLLGAALSFAQLCEPADLPLPATVDGSIADSDCRLREWSPSSQEAARADAWRLRITERTVLDIRVDAPASELRMLLLDDRRRVVAGIGMEAARAGSLLVQTVPGTYTLLVTAVPRQPVAYRFAISSAAPRACVEETLQPGVPLERDLGGSDCRYADLRVFENDARSVDIYKLEIPKRSVLELRMTSTAFDAYVAVADSRRRIVALNDDAAEGATDAAVLVSLDKGTYYVEASSAITGAIAAAGAYRLSAVLEDPRECAPRKLQPGASIAGSLDASDCRLLDLFVNSSDAALVDIYEFEIAERSVAAATMMSPAFDTYLALFDSQGEFIADNDDYSDRSTDSQILTSLAPGVYRWLATSYEPATGAYELVSKLEPPRPCAPAALALPGSAAGSIATGGCRVLDILVPSSDASPVSAFRIEVPRRSVLTLNAASVAFRTILALRDAAGDLIGATEGTAPLEFLLLPGSYLATVSPADSRTGEFSVSAAVADAKQCAAPPWDLKAPVQGALDSADCGIGDVLPGVALRTPSRADLYKIDLAAPQNLAVKAQSAAFAPVLIVLDSDFVPLFGVLNEAFENTVEFPWNAKAGSYYVVVTDLLGAAGPYTLTAESK